MLCLPSRTASAEPVALASPTSAKKAKTSDALLGRRWSASCFVERASTKLEGRSFSIRTLFILWI